MNIIKLWNLYADGDSQWDSLTEGEKLMFAMSIEREECAKLCDDEADDATEGEWDTCCRSMAKKIRARGTI